MSLKISLSASRWLGLAVGAATLCAPLVCLADPPSGSGWEEIEKKGGLTISTRDRSGTSIKETRAVGTLDAPNWVIQNVLDDVENYPSFMPYIVESKLLFQDPARHTRTVYTRMTPPLIDARDYTLLVHSDTHKAGDGTVVYGSHWNPANERGPAEKPGTVRVKVSEGSWVLESIDNGEHTRGTYTLFTDGGGGIPAFVFNRLSKQRLNELFAVLGKQAKESKYRAAKPATP